MPIKHSGETLPERLFELNPTRFPTPRCSPALVAGVYLVLAVSGLSASDFVLVQNGRPAETIVLAENPSENARAAARELQHYVRKITGVELTIAADTPSPAGSLILVGRSQLTAQTPELK